VPVWMLGVHDTESAWRGLGALPQCGSRDLWNVALGSGCEASVPGDWLGAQRATVGRRPSVVSGRVAGGWFVGRCGGAVAGPALRAAEVAARNADSAFGCFPLAPGCGQADGLVPECLQERGEAFVADGVSGLAEAGGEGVAGKRPTVAVQLVASEPSDRSAAPAVDSVAARAGHSGRLVDPRCGGSAGMWAQAEVTARRMRASTSSRRSFAR